MLWISGSEAAIAYVGSGVAAGSQWITILPLPLAITLRYSIVARKEGFLDLRFGDAYDDQGVCPPAVGL